MANAGSEHTAANYHSTNCFCPIPPITRMAKRTGSGPCRQSLLQGIPERLNGLPRPNKFGRVWRGKWVREHSDTSESHRVKVVKLTFLIFYFGWAARLGA